MKPRVLATFADLTCDQRLSRPARRAQAGSGRHGRSGSPRDSRGRRLPAPSSQSARVSSGAGVSSCQLAGTCPSAAGRLPARAPYGAVCKGLCKLAL